MDVRQPNWRQTQRELSICTAQESTHVDKSYKIYVIVYIGGRITLPLLSMNKRDTTIDSIARDHEAYVRSSTVF